MGNPSRNVPENVAERSETNNSNVETSCQKCGISHK